MKTVTLTKPWGGNPAGTTLEVDDLRAEALDKDGYLDQLAEMPVEAKAKAPAKGDKN
jgi:hypothetical protein